jgi:signal transduction histidine kinase
VEISLRAREGRLRLTVADNGRGFDPGSPPNKGQLGVAGMHERAGLAGGRLEIRARPGGGAEVRLDLPLGGPEGEPA